MFGLTMAITTTQNNHIFLQDCCIVQSAERKCTVIPDMTDTESGLQAIAAAVE